jgi:Ca2+-binding RTX toxin-like protein
VQTSPITLAGESEPRSRIENTGVWNGLKTLSLDADYWNPSLGSNLLVANFVDVRWDLSTAPPLDMDLVVVGAKRGAIDFGGGDDTLSWLFHSNEDTLSNTATVSGGDGDDVLRFSVVGNSTVDDVLLADNPGADNGALWTAGYDGRFSTAIASGGEGDDRIESQGAVRLQADGGAGSDILIGALANDTLIGGFGEDSLTGGGDSGSFRFTGQRSNRRVVVSGGDLIDLRAPGGGGDGAADTVTYALADGGVDRVVGFEAGRDRLQVLGGVGTAQVAEYRNGTFVSFTGRPLQGVLLEGVRGLSVGGAGDDIQLLA